MKVKYTSSKWFLENNGEWIEIDEKDQEKLLKLGIDKRLWWQPIPYIEYQLSDDVGFEIRKECSHGCTGEWESGWKGKFIDCLSYSSDYNKSKCHYVEKVAHLKVERKEQTMKEKKEQLTENTVSGYFSKDDDESIAFMEDMAREGIFFIEEIATQKWVMNEHIVMPGMDGITNDPHKAYKFKTKFEAMSYMVKLGLKLNAWTVTEHEFIESSNEQSVTKELRSIRVDLFSSCEKAILNAQYELEKVGSSEGLTEAAILLSKARQLVTDYLWTTKK